MTLVKGNRIIHPKKPGWGLGQVFDADSHKIHAYFIGGGRRCIDTRAISLVKVVGEESKSEILDTLSDHTWQYPRYSIYAIELNPSVWSDARYREENPNRNLAKPCLYVGMSRHQPELRLSKHFAGGMIASRWVYKYKEGARLRPDLYAEFNPMHKRLAELMEVERARQLRVEGYGVWQR